MNNHEGQVVVSSEKRFVYHESVNRGHVQLPRMMIACQHLSATAKLVYGVISGYVFEHGRSAFPSVASIAKDINCSRKTTIKYIDELVDKGFIIKKRHGNKRTNTYYLIDADKVAHLQVSEMFHRALKRVKAEIEGSLYDKAYAVFEAIRDDIDASDFREYPVNSETENILKAAILKAVMKESENGKKVPDTPPAVSSPTVHNAQSGGWSNKASDLLGRTSRFSLPDDVAMWKNDDFVQYFYERYLDAAGKTHQSARSKHRGMIGRVIKNADGNKERVKHFIDGFFQVGYDRQSLESFESFCTSGRAAEIDLFVKSGKKPDYLVAQEKKGKVERAGQENKGMSAADFLKRIKQYN